MQTLRRLFAQLQPGDLLLSGGRNFFSEVTQFATRSRFGHVMVVLGGGRLIQATDLALTPAETDEGVGMVSYDEFWSRTTALSDIRAIRPIAVDQSRLKEAAEYLFEHSPTYPSVGAIVLGFCCLTAGIVSGLPAKIKSRIVHRQLLLVADGPTRMHCAEFAIRLYTQAGVEVELREPVLAAVIDHSLALRPELLTLRLEKRRAFAGVWPAPLHDAAAYTIRESVATLRDRLDPSIERDHAGLILPADFERSPTFAPVFDVTRRHSDWYLNLVV